MYDSIIVGGGPAGLSAAIYLARSGRSVMVLEKDTCGGQLLRAAQIENYPGIDAISGCELARRMEQQAVSAGAELRFDDVLKVRPDRTVVCQRESYAARTVIAANGLVPRTLDATGEVRLTGRGVSYCAHCDGPLFRGKTVAVCGGGNSAAHEVLFLSQICETVHWIHRRDRFSAERAMLDRILPLSNVVPHPETRISELCGQERLSGIRLTGKSGGILRVDGLFIAIGQRTESDYLRSLGILDANGYILSNSSGETAIPWLFAAGDACRKRLRQAVTAASDGASAAEAALRYLQSELQT